MIALVHPREMLMRGMTSRCCLTKGVENVDEDLVRSELMRGKCELNSLRDACPWTVAKFKPLPCISPALFSFSHSSARNPSYGLGNLHTKGILITTDGKKRRSLHHQNTTPCSQPKEAKTLECGVDPANTGELQIMSPGMYAHAFLFWAALSRQNLFHLPDI